MGLFSNSIKNFVDSYDRKYRGNFRVKKNMTKITGLGIMENKNGDKYEGIFTISGYLEDELFYINKLNNEKFYGSIELKSGDKYEGCSIVVKNNEVKFKAGKIILNTGEIYKGTFEDSEVNMLNRSRFDKCIKLKGRGKKIYPTGEIHEGEFDEAGNLIGEGIITYPTGERHEGEFNEAGNLIGEGIITYPTGEIREGEFDENGNLIGKGIITYPTGTRCEVEFDEDGNLEGMIRITYKSGDVYEGECNGTGISKGKKVYKSGEVEEGEFDESGTFLRGKKSDRYEKCVYEGEFNQRGNLEGEGKMILSSGETIEGIFNREGKIDGKGLVTYTTGEQYECIFKNGNIEEPVEVKNLGIRTDSFNDIYASIKVTNKHYRPIKSITLLIFAYDKNRLPVELLRREYSININLMPQESYKKDFRLSPRGETKIVEYKAAIKEVEFFGLQEWRNKYIDYIVREYNNQLR